MTSLRRLTTSLVPFFVLGACSQLIGLSDYEKGGEGSAGEGGEETGGTSSGTNSGGSSGVAPKGNGGEGGDDTGGTSGTLGRGGTGRGGASTGGSGGEPDGGDPGQGGSSAGQGGATGGRTGGSGGMPGGTGGMGGGTTGGSAGTPPTGGSAGTGGSPACTEITIGALVEFTGSSGSAIYTFDFAPELGSAAQDLIAVQFWDGSGFDGALTGTFMLGTGDDANYATCSRCVLASSDDATTSSRLFFQTEGTLTVEPSSMQMTGSADFSLSNVTLREVTIDEEFNSTLVPGGACLHIESASYTQDPPPPDWDCDVGWYYDTDCDCGCGAPDPACANGDVASCDYCWCDTSGTCSTDEVNSTSNWICL